MQKSNKMFPYTGFAKCTREKLYKEQYRWDKNNVRNRICAISTYNKQASIAIRLAEESGNNQRVKVINITEIVIYHSEVTNRIYYKTRAKINVAAATAAQCKNPSLHQ